jgi:DNA-binding LacI/PurR family transcriptional regulator
MNATIYDIAREAGVSPMTVSRVLNGGPKGVRSDAVERAARILAVAEKMHYQPSATAKALKEGNTRMLGLVVGGIGEAFFAKIADAAMDEADRYGYHLLVSVTKWDFEKEAQCIESLIAQQVAGILSYVFFKHDAPVRQKLLNRQFPIVSLGAPDPEFPSFVTDMEQAMEDALCYLIAREHKEFAFLIPDPSPNLERKNFLHVCEKNEVHPLLFPYISTDPGSRLEKIEEICQRRPSNILMQCPKSIECTLQYIRQNCPEYTPEILYMTEKESQVFYPPLNTGIIVSSAVEKTRAAVRELLKMVENESVQLGFQKKIPSTFVSYESVSDKLEKKEAPLEQYQLMEKLS